MYFSYHHETLNCKCCTHFIKLDIYLALSVTSCISFPDTSWVIEKHTLYGGDGSLYDAGLACARKGRQSINSYTIETKYQAIIELEKGSEKGRIAEVARKFGLPFTTLATWAKNAAKIKEKYEQSEQMQKRTNIKLL